MEDFISDETDDPEDYTPDTLMQSIIGAGAVFVLFLALYGLAGFLHSLITTLAGLQ